MGEYITLWDSGELADRVFPGNEGCGSGSAMRIHLKTKPVRVRNTSDTFFILTECIGGISARHWHMRLEITGTSDYDAGHSVCASPISTDEIWILLTRHVTDTQRTSEYISLRTQVEDADESIPRHTDAVALKGQYISSMHVLVRWSRTTNCFVFCSHLSLLFTLSRCPSILNASHRRSTAGTHSNRTLFEIDISHGLLRWPIRRRWVYHHSIFRFCKYRVVAKS